MVGDYVRKPQSSFLLLEWAIGPVGVVCLLVANLLCKYYSTNCTVLFKIVLT